MTAPYQVLCAQLQARINQQDYEIATLRQIISEVRRLHRRDSNDRSGAWCAGCGWEYPCKTIRLVAGVIGERYPTGGVPHAEPPQMLVNMPVAGEEGHP